MEQNEQTNREKPAKKLKSLVAGRILSLVPFAAIALTFITTNLPILSETISGTNATGFFIILPTVPSFACWAVGLGLLLSARKKGGKKIVPFIVLCIIGMIYSALFTVSLLFLIFYATWT